MNKIKVIEMIRPLLIKGKDMLGDILPRDGASFAIADLLSLKSVLPNIVVPSVDKSELTNRVVPSLGGKN